MKYLKMLNLAAVAAMALMAFAAASASATTLEVGGVTKNQAVTIAATLEPETTATLVDTNSLTTDTCTGSEVEGTTQSPYTGATLTGPVSVLTFTGCSHTTTVLAKGTLHVAHIAGTTDGTLSSSGAKVRIKSTVFGINVTCETGEGTDIGRVTGKASGNATVDINAVVECGFVGTATWTGSYWVTSPSGLGVEG